ncbi:MAG: ADP-ribosylation factor-like protein [Pirellulales bacterium]
MFNREDSGSWQNLVDVVAVPSLRRFALPCADIENSDVRNIAQKLLNLHTLFLNHNYIDDAGARAIAENLPNLVMLDLSYNRIGPDGAAAITEKLFNLRWLNLSKNRLTDDAIRSLVEGLPNLETIEFSENRLINLPTELVVGRQEAASLRAYFRRLGTENRRKLNEAKLIVVGNESVGKTALVDYLVHDRPCRDTDKTPGLYIQDRIEVSQWNTSGSVENSESLSLNVWDFGGQEVTRETHKLFLTSRSLYLIVLEARRENTIDAENIVHDWMRAIRNRGGTDVPVLVVINKSEGNRELRLDEASLKQSYPIREFIRTSCRDPKIDPDGGKGINELRLAIIRTIRLEIPQTNAEFPISYFEIKERLREIAKAEQYFDIMRFVNICHEVASPVSDSNEQRSLLQLLSDIGVVPL